ncbi:unnamed protein product [marine sediment metagenome]|uniref:Uncharacterized protein n=1 Tax=marine sediment metagenome TaxID=412755 RepID=X0UZ60_9ZZZZ
MKGYEVYDNTLVIRLKPLATLYACLQGNVGYVTQVRNCSAEIVMEMSAQVVHDVVK